MLNQVKRSSRQGWDGQRIGMVERSQIYRRQSQIVIVILRIFVTGDTLYDFGGIARVRPDHIIIFTC